MKYRLASWLVNRLSTGQRVVLEELTRTSLGKGWAGSGTHKNEVRAFLALLQPSDRQEPVVFDVGANTGVWARELLTQAPGANVWCFEPSQKAFLELEMALGLDQRVVLVNAAVAGANGKVQLWTDEWGSGLASLSKRRLDHFGREFNRVEEVDAVCLDAWVHKHAVNPVGIKLDIEGHELTALLGAASLLRSVSVVQFEFGGANIDSRTYFQDFFYLFKRQGFRIFRLQHDGLSEIDRYRETDEVFLTTVFFAQRTLAARV